MNSHSIFQQKLRSQGHQKLSQDCLNKLIKLIPFLELSLYQSAPSFEAYTDKSALKYKLELLAEELYVKANDHPEFNEGANGERHLRTLPELGKENLCDDFSNLSCGCIITN